MMSWLDIDYNSLQLREIGVWPLFLRIIIVVSSGLVFMVLLYCLWFAPKIELLTRHKSFLYDKCMDLSTQKNMLSTLNVDKNALSKLQIQYESFANDLQINCMSELLDKISELVVDNNMKITSVKIYESIIPSNLYQISAVELSAEASYHQIAAFMTSVAMYLPMLGIDSMVIGNNRVDVKFNVYFEISKEIIHELNINHDTIAIPKIMYHCKNLRSPFAEILDSNVSAEAGIKVGSMRNNNNCYSLIKDNFGTVHMVLDNDY